MNKRKLYDLTINALIFSRLCTTTEWYGHLMQYHPYPLHILKNIVTKDILVAFAGMEWTIHKYGP
jgi:hypothetical protein